ncbi:MAG: single-stranded-DNA-specific exonuclease RecJ [Pseudomonadota bacterium]
MEWFIQPADFTAQQGVSQKFGLHLATAQVLINRGISQPQTIQKFLNPNFQQIPDPFILPDMDQATDRIIKALKQKEKIAIYGDYDVDGLTGTALLCRFFKRLGVEPIVFIPNRLTQGYGLHSSAIKELKAKGVNLLITVDCGTRSLEEVKFAQAAGLDVIITDHHEVDDALPKTILINPKRADFISEDKELAGCALAYFLLAGLQQKLIKEAAFNFKPIDLAKQLDLVALGTVADIVPLIGLNRLFAKLGLEVAQDSENIGVRALIEACGLNGMPLRAVNVAFRLAPRINAAGRLGQAGKALELLTTDNKECAADLALLLNNFNLERQALEKKVLEEALEIIAQKSLASRPAIVVASKNWHPGVVGIVASKLSERYKVPSAVIALDELQGRGSLRTATGLNIVDALGECADLLHHFGGHAQAAGLTIDAANLDVFQERFERSCGSLSQQDKALKLKIDAMVDPSALNLKLAKEVEA